jgi:hypothetical protein
MAKAKFHTRDHAFRPTALSLALVAAGMTTDLHLVREPKREGLLRAKTDKFNIEPSVRIAPLQSDIRPDKRTWKSQTRKAA